MAKWILCLLVVGGLTFTTYSCKDYDDDIDDLNDKIKTLQGQIDKIKTSTDKGSSISKVEPTTTGIKITMSDNTVYEINNGKNGATWTIGEDGFWYKDGAKTTYPARGEKGDKGDKGDTGTSGGNGSSDVYTPGDDGYWYKNGVKTDTKWRVDGTITAVVKDGVVYLHGVPGFADGYPLSMNTGDLKGLVLEANAIVEGYPAIEFSRLSYRPLDNEGVFANTNASVKTILTNTPFAVYHMNPSSVKAEMIKTGNLTYNYKDAKIISRSASSEPRAEFVEIKDGRLKVKVLAKSENIFKGNVDSLDLIALQVPLAGDNAPVITSDYAAMVASVYDNFAIAHAGKTYNSLNSFKTDGSGRPKDGLYFYNTKLGLGAFDNTENIAANDYYKAYSDTSMVYNGPGIDLAGVVTLAEFPNNPSKLRPEEHAYDRDAINKEINLAEYGFTYKFDVVSTTLGQSGAGKTDQKDFVKLVDGHKLVTDVYGTGATTAAIGRTPIIKVSLMNGTEVVKVAFIKVEITGTVAPKPEDIIFKYNDLPVSCDSTFYGVDVKQMNLQVYSKLGLSKEQFHTQYQFVPNDGAPNVGKVTGRDPLQAGSTESTQVLTWRLGSTDLWTNVGKEISYVAKYVNTTNSSSVSIKLTAKVVAPNVQINQSDVYKPFWDKETNPEYFKQNVRVPGKTETDSTKASYSNILYSGFRTYQGLASSAEQHNNWIDFSRATDYTNFKTVYDNMYVNYTFAKENEAITSYGKNVTGVKVTLSADSRTLYVNGVAALEIVQDPSSPAIPGVNTIQVVETPANGSTPMVSSMVKRLISSGDFYAIINTAGTACGINAHPVKIGGTYSTFKALFVTPVIAQKTKNAGQFQDGESDGSRVNVYSLLSLIDWRKSPLVTYNDKTNQVEYTNLFEYYGVNKIAIDGTVYIQAKGNTNPENKYVVKAENISIDNSTNEFIYKNEGSPLSIEHELLIPLKIYHKWGEAKITIDATIKPSL